MSKLTSSYTRCIAALVSLLAMPAQEITYGSPAAASSSERRVVVELFTSQGCSSCPPADAILGELTLNSHVIALGFHVDYWDDIGWHDRYSMPEATVRQRRYVDALNLSSAFTPQIVIGGHRSVLGSDRQRVLAAIADAPAELKFETAVEADQLVISLPDMRDGRRYDVNVIAYLPQATTRIDSGENSGRSLTEFDIVRQIRRMEIWDGKPKKVSLPLASFPGDAGGVAVLIQLPDGGAIAAASAVSIR